MFESVAQSELRAQMEQHLLMVEEVLGGLDQFVQPNEQGCPFIEKLKSGSQLAALLKSETGRGIL